MSVRNASADTHCGDCIPARNRYPGQRTQCKTRNRGANSACQQPWTPPLRRPGATCQMSAHACILLVLRVIAGCNVGKVFNGEDRAARISQRAMAKTICLSEDGGCRSMGCRWCIFTNKGSPLERVPERPSSIAQVSRSSMEECVRPQPTYASCPPMLYLCVVDRPLDGDDPTLPTRRRNELVDVRWRGGRKTSPSVA
jgi:hypothetical protein